MSKNIHFIAIGGSAMHNLALALHDMGHTVTGSDDEIYEPSKTRLSDAGILPETYGWFPSKIKTSLDAVILGMHARADNPELAEAKKLELPIYSYPEYVALNAREKQRMVVAGSHGKTTTTSMIMHVLSKVGRAYDYLVGAQLEGFDRMVKLTDAPLIILEGDEYLSSPIDRRPKMMHYDPDIAVITGVAWDHINVFPTFDNYVDQFRMFMEKMPAGSELIYYSEDPSLLKIIEEGKVKATMTDYTKVDNFGDTVSVEDRIYKLSVIGNHNMQNVEAARLACKALDIDEDTFFSSIQDFKGAAKRLQLRGRFGNFNVFQDFAHAPSKVKATCDAVKHWFGKRRLYAFLELHTFSSLNKDFLPQYKGSLDKADKAFVIFDDHILKMKKMPDLSADFIQDQFDHPDLTVLASNDGLAEMIKSLPKNGNLLMMSSGTFGGLNWGSFCKETK